MAHHLAATPGHSAEVTSVTFSDDGKLLVSVSKDQFVRLWDVESGQERSTLKGHAGEIGSVAVSPDGRWIASASSSDGTVKIWDAKSGQQTTSMSLKVQNVAFSSNSRTLAAASWYHIPAGTRMIDTIATHMIDTEKWQVTTLTLNGDSNRTKAVAFGSDVGRLVTGSGDGTVKLWDTTSGLETLNLKGHTGQVNGVAFSRDGKRLASASSDHTVRVWDARPWTPELKGEQQALNLVRFHFRKGLFRAEVLKAISNDMTITAAVRQFALELARTFTETPEK